MSDLVVEQAPLLVALRDVLRAAGLRCEVGRPPAPQPGQKAPTTPYVVLYSIDGGEFYGGLDEPESCATQVVQATTVAEQGKQATMVADEVRRVLLGRANGSYLTSLDHEGQKVKGRRSLGMGGHDPDSVLVSLPERYEFLVNRA